MNVLFLCTANSCRSILCEALFNHLAPPGMQACSAGSQPRGEVNAQALAALRRAGVATDGLSSKAVEAHAGLAPELVITVCDKAAGDACPVFFGPALKAHWGLADPSELAGTPAQIDAAFDATLERIRNRLAAFFASQPGTLDREALQAEVRRIGSL
ncbi:arsenate reductase [Pseudomonas pohangensis]|uniref:Arsenate reductase n=1 Tax=Pseudomonas pohangensis TaxID=364197 RepID=A0A1H2FLR3_9PSED|nr:arsenate reductase ArsC [Pseudomonas pohangensis]SDU08265.1 arsenate reductase [Pseudomonas pohangensis]